MRITFTLLVALQTLGVANAPLATPPPGIRNALVETRSAAVGLEGVFRSLLSSPPRTAWVGYAFPAANRQRPCSCGFLEGEEDGRMSCSREGTPDASRPDGDGPASVLPEAPARRLIFFWIDGGRIRRLHMPDEDCAIDLCGQPLVWLTDVRPAESVGLLASLAGEDAPLAGRATAAIAFHADPQAVDVLLDLARNAPRTSVRGHALFWLAHRAGERAVAGITRALAEDPETEVKKKAVFALSRLPPDRGVPLLIETARSNRNPAVRKRAMFWLGQSKDPRALAYFEEVLKP
ncbi:MAG TPA: HEAT repeat domain-containing protein [Vicinamibacteria bacterium]|nr:HEAT repeat domain-containing protein [Vicinamibacteria bacterium]